MSPLHTKKAPGAYGKSSCATVGVQGVAEQAGFKVFGCDVGVRALNLKPP